MEKVWTIEEIRKLIDESDTSVARAIVAVYNLQTEDEKVVKETSHSNGVGFSGADANFLSSLAQFYQEKGFLTQGQVRAGRKGIKKYAGQLVALANKTI